MLTIDFETYYDSEYSLSKMTTEEYIRDPRFEVIGVSVKRDTDKARWFTGTFKDTQKWLAQFDWDEEVALAHNAAFDMAILNWHFDIRPKRIADTLSMARALDGPDAGNSLAKLAERHGAGVKGDEVIHALGKRRLDFSPSEIERYGRYCVNDVELTYKLFEKMAEGFPLVELRLIDLTIRMFTEPELALNTAALDAHLNTVKAKKDELMAAVAADKSQLMSNPKLANLLESMGVEPPKKFSPTTGKETWAFGKNDEKFKALLEHTNPAVQAAVAARMGVKSTLEETRTERFIGISKRGKLPIPLRYYAAHTGRWGGDDRLNMQNLPRKSPLKKAIQAPEGYLVIDCDSSQIEARVLAWMAQQEDLVAAFEKGEDVYKIMASSIYGKPVEEITDSERFVGKTTILGSGYGMGGTRFKAQLKTFNVDTPLDECNRIIAVYRSTYSRIPALWQEAQEALDAMTNNQTAPLGRDEVLSVEGENGIRLPNGLMLRYPGLRWVSTDGKTEMVYDTKRGKVIIPNRIYGGKCTENFTQALARIIVGQQMLKIAKRYRVVMTVHDSVVTLVPEAEADEARKYIEQCMRSRPKWAPTLPLNCESKVGASYGG